MAINLIIKHDEFDSSSSLFCMLPQLSTLQESVPLNLLSIHKHDPLVYRFLQSQTNIIIKLDTQKYLSEL